MRVTLIITTAVFACSVALAQTLATSASRELETLKRSYEGSLDRLLIKSIKAGDVAAVTEVSLEIDRITPGPPKIEKGEAPVGLWKWIKDTSTIIYANGLVSNGEHKGIWKWTNKSKREFQIKWSNGYIDQIIIAPDSKSIQGTTSENYKFKAEFVIQEN